jgi:predicted transglutaminase-like cysteine proteinase
MVAEEVAVQRCRFVTRWLARAAVCAGVVLACAPLPSLAGSPLPLIASLAPSDPVEVPTWQLPKWQRIRDWLASAGATSDPRLTTWTTWATSLRGRPVMERLTAINLRVNQSFRYASDFEVWGVADYWETPPEVIAKQATDCEGFAIFKYWLARLAGVPDEQLFMMVGIIGSTHQMHAVLIAGEADRGYVLDVRTPYVADMATFGDFRLLAAVDLQSVKVFIKRSGGAAAPVAFSLN